MVITNYNQDQLGKSYLQFIKIGMNLKTLKLSKPKSPEIKILDRKTDNYGRTMYQVCWITEKNKITWQYIPNMKNFYNLITEFEKKYQQRVINWQNGSFKNQRNQQKIKERIQVQNIEMEPKQINKNRKMVEINSSNQQQQQNQRVQEIVQYRRFGGQQQDFETADKSHMLQQNTKLKNPQDNHENPKNAIIMAQEDQNLTIAKLLCRFSPNIRRKRRPFIIKRREIEVQQQERDIEQIKQIYVVNKVWYARVTFKGNEQAQQMLRDEVRIRNPNLLLLYYEKKYEEKMKDFSTKA